MAEETKKWKNHEIVTLRDNIDDMKGYENLKFLHKLNKNYFKAEDALKPLVKLETETLKLVEEYNKEKDKINREHCKKDSVGDPELKKAGYIEKYQFEPSEGAKVKDKISTLKEKYKEKLDEFETKSKQIKEILDEENADFQPVMIDEDQLPVNLKSEHHRAIFHLIKFKD